MSPESSLHLHRGHHSLAFWNETQDLLREGLDPVFALFLSKHKGKWRQKQKKRKQARCRQILHCCKKSQQNPLRNELAIRKEGDFSQLCLRAHFKIFNYLNSGRGRMLRSHIYFKTNCSGFAFESLLEAPVGLGNIYNMMYIMFL